VQLQNVACTPIGAMMHLVSKSLVVLALGLIAFGEGGGTSAQPRAADLFHQGLTALHQFEYEDANEAFIKARETDPAFVMAYWGEAMTWHQTLWRNENAAAARQALARLAPTPSLRQAKTTDPKVQRWLGAVERLFGDGDAEARRRQYADAMAQLHAETPEDPDVASLYALALLGTMSRSLIGYGDAHEGHNRALAGSETQAQVAEILEGVLRTHPEHPGALHYLLHNHDDPAHASRALAAARTLARLAPESSHTRHMPAHIFLQLGLWQDAERSDRSAFAASEAWIARKQLDPAMRNYHALSWRQYELLQLGRYREARAAIDELAPIVKASGQLHLLSDLSSMRARYVIEAADWPRMASENNFGNANELFAIAISAANSGGAERAERARRGLAERAQDPREGDLRPAIAIMEHEVSALIAHAAGRGDDAVRILQQAAQLESQLPAPLGLPAPIKPAPELLGEILVTLGRPREAVPFFEQALARNPNRSRSVLGLARAATAAGDADGARRHYAALLGNFDRADADLPLVREARAAAATPASPAAAPAARDGRITAAIAASIIVVAGALFVWRRRQSAAASKPARQVTRKRQR
jgi:tetratricopeptide (TPR) repeat protein